MTRFIRIRDGSLINLANVARIVRVESQDNPGGMDSLLYDRDGNQLGTRRGYLDLEDLVTAVVPAAPGAMGYFIHFNRGGDNHRPTKADIRIDRMPIIAWRIDEGEAFPVYLDKPLTGGTALTGVTDLVETPD